MSIATELTNYKTYLTNAYNKCAEKEAVIPANRNMQNITNCIDSINRYTELTYIESSGTQYIDTGIVPSATIKIISKQSQNVVNSQQGCEYTSSYRYRWGTNGSSQLYLGFGGSNLASSGNYEPNKPYIYVLERGNQKVYDAEGNVLVTGSVTSNTYNTSSIPIFALKRGATISQYHKLRQYYYQIYDNGTLLRDFIPVLDSNNVACMYDKVNNVFYYNQGTGTFVAGDVVLDYIESTGTQYINTSVASEVNTKVDMKVMFPQISSSNAWFFGINYTNNFLVSLGVNASYPRFQYRSPNYVFSFSPTISTNTKYQVEAYFGASSQYVKVNGTNRLSKTESLVNGSNQGSFRLFNILDQGDTNLNMRLYSCKIYKDDVLKADFIPVLKADTKEPCLYDKTRNLYKANLGTGTFLFG